MRWSVALSSALLVASVSACASDPEGVHVEVLVSVRHLAPGSAWDLETQSFRATYAELLSRSGYRVVVTPISDHSLGEASLFDQIAPIESFFGSNHDDAQSQRTVQEKKAEGALSVLDSRRSGPKRTEIINAIVGAKDRFEADSRFLHRLLIIVSTGFEQSSVVNMADYNLKLNWPFMRKRLIDHLKATGQVVDLRAVDVCMLAITSGDGNWADYNRSRGVRKFWEDYLAAGGANLVGYGGTIGSCRALTTRSAETQ
jgi:hypothetical protein